MLSFGHHVGIHGRTLYRVPEVLSTCIKISPPSTTLGGGVRSAASPTPRRPMRSFDDLNSRSVAPFGAVTFIEVGSMLGMESSTVADSRGLDLFREVRLLARCYSPRILRVYLDGEYPSPNNSSMISSDGQFLANIAPFTEVDYQKR